MPGQEPRNGLLVEGGKICCFIDRGGTFTDCVATFPVPVCNKYPHGLRTVVIKLLSEDPAHYPDAPREGIRQILEIATGKPFGRNKPLDTQYLETIRMGTTVATNALLERKGEDCALLITKGLKDLLLIGDQSRPKIFDLSIQKPGVIYKQVVEVDERVTLVGYSSNPHSTYAGVDLSDPTLVKGVSGEFLRVLKPLDTNSVARDLQRVYDLGIRSVAICLVHSFTFPDHERRVADIARSIGFTHITLSSQLMPMIKLVPRAHSATADAYLTPCIRRYTDGFVSGFDDRLKDRVRVDFMQSDGGLAPMDSFSGLHAILSGPAAGVVGYAVTSYSPQERVPVIGFDMGGTSTDVSRFDGRFEHVFETSVAGITIQAPQLDINTVAAGGGSRLFFRNGLFVTGPESAGAHPGPACYRKGGPLTITDANLLLGRLQPDLFPAIFGPNEDQPLDIEATRKLFDEMACTIANETGSPRLPIEQVALGFLRVANEAMCRPIRALTEAKGHSASHHVLACFGGAGGQHACAVAANLDIKRIFIHKYASVLSAYGLSQAEVVQEEQEPSSVTWSDESIPELQHRASALCEQCVLSLEGEGFSRSKGQIKLEVYLNMRYMGTDTSIMVPQPRDESTGERSWAFLQDFEAMHRKEFGFALSDREVVVDDVRVRGSGSTSAIKMGEVYDELASLRRVLVSADRGHDKLCVKQADVYFENGYQKTSVYRIDALSPGHVVRGPAILVDINNTLLVEPGWEALVTSTQIVLSFGGWGNVAGSQSADEEGEGREALEKISWTRLPVTTELDPIQLSVFGHRFMSIAEQMGRTLRKTSISTNIKERLDFSCALFSPDGGLVANAPHIPVHLGSMSHAVRFQMKRWEGKLREGDVLVTNHPQAGGSHLPDITVITPVFRGDQLLFFVASRGHHADIGGITPGSMPPHSKELYQEGACIVSLKLVDGGVFQEESIMRALVDEPSRYPGCSGTRCIKDVMSDLKAQIAANNHGINLLRQLIDEYGQDVVQAYMYHIQHNAEMSVRDLLRKKCREVEGRQLEAEDYMDDGSVIKLKVTLDGEEGSAVFDFTGTSPQVYANTNAPPAVTYSAIIYSLRSMISSDLPLNQGCLAPVRVEIPARSLLNPSATAAVVGGNVLTSQRLVDVVLKAFGASADSQGCMNNLSYGIKAEVDDDGRRVEGWGYYETIAGGHGAGPTWRGKDVVHTNMTNTKITDVEIAEKRYPVVIHQFGVRAGSGGAGKNPGGNGCIRDIEFLIPMEVSLLCERRVFAPNGINGGKCGARGLNIWRRLVPRSQVNPLSPSSAAETSAAADERAEGEEMVYQDLNLGGKNTVRVGEGDHIIIHTPGGGGWGTPDSEEQ
ncbi:hypothetical protein EV182_000135 [Spiromyces aspiralis]|uniref:Uncharacterized protein n=1 Tax=Spiromyces aspiralis TaxID=68401 RepID=A0ACC1HUV2_9FUNG|nr:hypothetical protein EV182_000135 [Spiromyces aspiralis]